MKRSFNKINYLPQFMCVFMSILFIMVSGPYSFAHEEIISDKIELNKKEIELKYVFPTGENWRKNGSLHWSTDLGIKENYTKFEPSEIRFNINQSINGISISGILIPRKILDTLNSSWGNALVRFTREEDGKFFEIYVSKIIFDTSINVCQGYTHEKFDLSLCKLSSAEPMKIDNNIISEEFFSGSTFSFKDIDYDGEEELIVNEMVSHRSGSVYIAYNIINTKHDFRLEEKPNSISAVYSDGDYNFDEDKKLLIVSEYSSCCNWTTYTWKAEKGSYNLIEISDNHPEHLSLD